MQPDKTQYLIEQTSYLQYLIEKKFPRKHSAYLHYNEAGCFVFR